MKTPEETFESNKLIAEFMGAKKTGTSTIADDGTNANEYSVFINPHDPHSKIRYFEKSTWCGSLSILQYHTSWDWLMPVVEKIFNLRHGFDAFTDKDYKLYCKAHEVFNMPLKTEIKDAYTAVVSFIKWYNQQQKQS